MNKPVIGVPYINRPDLFQRLCNSISIQRERVVDFDYRFAWNTILDPDIIRENDIGKRWIYSSGHNLGVSASWNAIIKSTPLAPYWLILNSDIELGANDLAKIKAFVEPRLDTHGLLLCHGFSAFVITPLALERVGFFDENIYPAYLEDCDYHYRAKLAGIKDESIPDLDLIHGEMVDGKMEGSRAINSNPIYSRENGRTHQGNFEYYRAKWGGINGEEIYTHPFNDPHNNLDYWSFDFARYKRQQWNLS
jgi:GT2 family glycosyltransferase